MESFTKVKSKKDLELKLIKIMKNKNISDATIKQKIEYTFNILEHSKDFFVGLEEPVQSKDELCYKYENNFNFKINVSVEETPSFRVSTKDTLNEYYIYFPVTEYKYCIKSIDEESLFMYINEKMEDIESICCFTSVQDLLSMYDTKPLNDNIPSRELTSCNIEIYKSELEGLKGLNTIYDSLTKVQDKLNNIMRENFSVKNYRISLQIESGNYHKLNQISKFNINISKKY
jgi:hypothetical protein